ncbi:MAG: tRNA nucleotidyltransferase, partial [Candidatus Kapaibacteriota bacterium]
MPKINLQNLEKITSNKIFYTLSELAIQANYELYVVGGFVRDLFLGKEVKDIDFTIVGDAIKFAEIVAKKFNTKAIIYERFGTALVPIGDLHLEFVGTRKEVYDANSRNPIVTIGTLKDDIYRRDFTINSLAISLNKSNYGELIDLLGGIEDLEKELIRTPLDPIVTYNDD